MPKNPASTPISSARKTIRSQTIGRVRGIGTVTIAVLIVGWAIIWGRRVQASPDVKLGAAPLVGQWKFRPSIGYLMPMGLALLVIIAVPRFFARLQTRWVVLSTVGLTAMFTAALAGADGRVAMLEPVVHRTEYWAWINKMPPVRQMLANYDEYDFIVNFSTHIKGHPPGYMLFLKAMASVGLAKPWMIAVASYISAGIVAGSVLVVARRLGTARFTRKLAPMLIVAPYAVWMGTSADAVFSALVAAGAAGLAMSATSGLRCRRMAFALLAGLSIGAGLYSSWGTVTCGVLLAGVLWCATAVTVDAGTVGLMRSNVGVDPTKETVGERIRRALPTATWAFVGIGASALTMTSLGYNYFAGMGLTRGLYWKGTAQFRPWKYFLVGNLGALIIALGMVCVIGLGVLSISRAKRFDPSQLGLANRETTMVEGENWLSVLVLCTLTGILAANFSQYSKGEVERIWLPFMPWLTMATGLLNRHRFWLLVQATSAIGLQVMLLSKW